MRFAHLTAALALAVTLSTPALAHPHDHHPGARPDGPDLRPDWREGGYDDRDYDDMRRDPGFDRAREDWLADCRRRVSDNGVGGAVIGGVAGGVLGNRIAGRGNRTAGTIAGVAAGAVAGAVIDRAEDGRRNRDQCEAYLDDYYARGPGYAQGGYAQGGYPQGGAYPGYAQGYPAYGYPTYGYAGPMVMVPVMMPSQKPCVETVVTEEYVTRPARRVIPRRAPDKRVRIAPDKRVPLK